MDERHGIVIDPYCGSGTTLVAAKILKHDFIGIEISVEYINFAEERLRNFKQEEKFVQEEIARHIVLKTFKERKEKGEFTGKYGPKGIKKQQELIFFDNIKNRNS